MKADKFPLPKINKEIDDMAGSKIFINSEMFAGYWEIKLAKTVQKKTEFRCKLEFFQLKVIPF